MLDFLLTGVPRDVKTTKPMSQPSCCPTELQVAAYPTLPGFSIVRAHLVARYLRVDAVVMDR